MRSHHKWFTTLAVTVGVVITALATSGSSLAVSTPSETAHKAPQAIQAPFPVSGAQDLTDVVSDATRRLQEEEWARQEAIAQLEAEQAQALADQLQAAVNRSLAAVPPPAPVAAPAPTADCNGVNQYAAYIYQRESGCRTDAYNPGGCRGIGQACPGSKLPCSDSDFACQHEWFEGYALARYGSWEAAYQFWIQHFWW